MGKMESSTTHKYMTKVAVLNAPVKFVRYVDSNKTFCQSTQLKISNKCFLCLAYTQTQFQVFKHLFNFFAKNAYVAFYK